ncbi:MAG: DUF1517 domain-containing protein, partial [Kofleriaceae bacterium]
MKRWILVVLACVWTSAFAQTGGSMGGGSWGGGGGGGGGGYSGHSSSSSSSSHSYGGGYSSSGGSGSLGGGVAMLAIMLVLWAVVAVAQASKTNAPRDDSYLGLSDFTPMESADVSVLRVAIDGRARKFVQSELARIAKLADTATPEGQATMLREVALTLRRLRDAWVYAGAVNEPMRGLGEQKGVFDRYVNDARARFREETVRNEQGVQTATAAGAYTPRTEEGAGLILVSLIIAARRELFTVRQIGNGDDLRAALEGAGTLDATSLVAIEVVW